MSKQSYIDLLEETLNNAQHLLEREQTTFWKSVVNQLKDIQKNVVEQYNFEDWEEVYDRYTIGTIAAKQLPDGNDMQQRLFSLFWGAVHWKELQK